MTAWSALKVTGDIFLRGPSGMRALVIGGSGGVGTIAIQLLKNWGVEISDCEAGISAEEGVRAEGGAGETIRAQARKTERRSKSAETRRRRQKPPARFESRPIEHCQIDKCRQEMTISRIRRAAQLVGESAFSCRI
ncbi:unnamed protein product [Nesidiocoris tenuis]|uniref:Uncharacterized protein n=1 Tax=Nesidiocoris tenuis TaxID=355587 RepID=A0A6H5GHR4_9HEMI|nr:unnamed protein product [Nesidiocoris tenuis]